MYRVCLAAAFVMMAGGRTNELQSAEQMWVVPEPVGFDGKVHVCIHGHVGDSGFVTKAPLWRLSESKECTPVRIDIGEWSFVAEGQKNCPGSTYFLTHDLEGVKAFDSLVRVRLSAKSCTSPDPSTWKVVRDPKKLPLEIVPTRDRNRMRLSVILNGKQNVDASVTVQGPDSSEIPIRRESNGGFAFEPSISGHYGIVAVFNEGSRDGTSAADAVLTRHVSTLTLPFEVIPRLK